MKILYRAAAIAKNVGSGLWKGYKLIDGAYGGIQTVFSAVKVTKAGGQVAARTAWAGLGTAARVTGAVGVVFDVVFIPVDLAIMMKSAYDVHKYKKTGKSNSAVAEKIGKLITNLEEHRDELKRQCQ